MYIRTVELTGWPRLSICELHRTGRLPPSSILLVHILSSLLPSKLSPCPPSPLPLHCGFSSSSLISLTSANFVALRTCALLLEGTISRFLTSTAWSSSLSGGNLFAASSENTSLKSSYCVGILPHSLPSCLYCASTHCCATFVLLRV